MTRFVSPNLAGLAPPPGVEDLDYEAILAARLEDLGDRATAIGLTELPAILGVESEPLTLGQETGSYYEMVLRARVNDAMRACLIATATGAQLDHLASTFYGVARLLITPADEEVEPPVAAIYEDDETFRARALLSIEARSVAGPEGAYVYFALQADADVKDAACYGEEDGAKYEDDSDVTAPEVLIVVLSRTGNGEPDEDLLETVTEALNDEEIRPIGDKVTVEPATIVEYSVEGVVKYATGADPGVIVAEAEARIQAYADARHRIGRVVQLFGIAAALKVTDAEEVELVVLDADDDPITDDIDPGSKGAAFCTSIAVTAEVVDDSWRA